MNKIHVIDLLNKIANGEEVPNKIIIDHWCHKFEWVEHLDNYYDKSADVDLMSVLSMSKEELNYEVKIIQEEKDKPIESIKSEYFYTNDLRHNELVSEIALNRELIIELKKGMIKYD